MNHHSGVSFVLVWLTLPAFAVALSCVLFGASVALFIGCSYLAWCGLYAGTHRREVEHGTREERTTLLSVDSHGTACEGSSTEGLPKGGGLCAVETERECRFQVRTPKPVASLTGDQTNRIDVLA